MTEPIIAEVVDPNEETALTMRAETSFLQRMEQIENAAAIFERRAALLESAHTIAVRRTRPEDWVLFKDRQGNANAMLTASGADLVADVFGIQIENVRPLDERGVFKPDIEPVAGLEGVYTVRAWCDAWSRVTGRAIQSLEFSRRSDEDFTGRSVDASGKIVSRGVGALTSDLRAAVQTGLRTKAVRVLCGMTRIPVAELDKAWAGTTPPKKSADCRKGAGFGTSQDRTAGGVAEEGVRDKAKALWTEILRRVHGDTEAASQLLREITSYSAYTNKDGKAVKAFAGIKSWEEFTKEWGVDKAFEKLRQHPQFGDHAGREPGED